MEVQVGGKKMTVLSEAHADQLRRIARTIGREPFTKRAWAELLYFLLSALLTAVSIAFIGVTMFLGIVLAITFLGIIIIAASLRGSRGLGGFHRALARSFLDEHIEEPDSFVARPGFFGWLQSALRDRTAWRAMAYCVLKVPLTIFGVWFALSIWIDSLSCFLYALFGSGAPRPGEFGILVNVFQPGFLSVGSAGFFHHLFVLVTGVVLLFVAPWAMRLVIFIDRWLMRGLLSPDAMTMRVRSLEQARAQTVDSSAATLRRIERDLHDGTQAQLVTLAMRLGQAKEKLARGGDVDLDQVRQLVDQAHQGAKEAIVDLRDLARGIHPPALDVGLEGALATLAARSTVPTEVTVTVYDRPTPAIEAIAYFCVAELLANVAQHAHASKATVTCVEHGQWLRVVVRDDGQGGARPSQVGSASSGLAGLTERVRAVDGRLDIMSPTGGPTVVAVDLPLHA
ncbi:MAG TPA: sensor domain-containing protein [Acidimicrobiales bacterium]|nr:sensor domain-containing protein [Acidimicrobiales bacterium]